MTWSVPRMWDGQRVAILASGPSMSQEVADLVRYTTLRTIAINNTFLLAPFADMVYGSDANWWAWAWAKHRDKLEKYEALKVCLEPCMIPGVLQLNNTGKDGFDPDPRNIRTGGNSGYAAIHVAAHAGCKQILLCGFDMRGKHWHGDHPEGLRNAEPERFEQWIERFNTLAPELIRLGIEVLNCTPGSALKCFPVANLENVLARPVLVT